MRSPPNIEALQKNSLHVPSAATAAIVTLAAVAGEIHVIDQITWSYSAAPTGGRLTVAINSVTVLDIDITSAGPGSIQFTRGLHGIDNQAVVVTLASGAGSVAGKVNVQHR